MATPLPSRRDKVAPIFDPAQPRTLIRYFEDLGDLFMAHQVTMDDAKKAAALKYVPMAVEDLWKTLPEYRTEHTYGTFIAAAKKLYPAVSEDRRYTVGDLDRLTGERARIGVHTLADLGAYYREFILITRFLIAKDLLSTREQNRAFESGFQAELWHRISHRLEIKDIDHPPDTAYAVQDVYNAAAFLL
ncbi:hypothetical protein NEOLEDRAFT_1067663, partial [Neolentinus lepideus HHB14362 ss-1]